MHGEAAETPPFLTFEDAVDYYLTEPVWYVGTAEGVLAPYDGTPDQARALLASERGLFED